MHRLSPASSPPDEGTSQGRRPPSRQQTNRACDRCRRTKSRCDKVSPEQDKCQGCIAAGEDCIYSDVIYKRGPPKGYIGAIEQRWQQVESVLGAIISSGDARAQNIITALNENETARDVMARVDAGPWGSLGRNPQRMESPESSAGASSTTALSPRSPQSPEASQSLRHSRTRRESISSDTSPTSEVTSDWQDQLISLLENAASFGRREQETSGSASLTPEWSSLYSMYGSFDESEEHSSAITPGGIGQLSFDEHNEARFFGETSGLHMLLRDEAGGHGGDRHFEVPTTISPSSLTRPERVADEPDALVEMPTQPTQDGLVSQYFIHVHQHMPVVHQDEFRTEYSNRRYSTSGDGSMTCQQFISKLLLLAMFSLAAMYPVTSTAEERDAYQSATDYYDRAKNMLKKTFQHSRTSTCQALLLLGYREFGMGQLEQGWMSIGMAARMATALGLNHNVETWKHEGADMFTPAARETRNRIWWACCIAEKFASIHMRQLPVIVETDYNTPFPTVQNLDDCVFKVRSSLSITVGCVSSLVYALAPPPASASNDRESVEARLNRWMASLDGTLQYDYSNQAAAPPASVLLLHIEFWMAVLQLHQAFVPNWDIPSSADAPAPSADIRAFDLAQSSAAHITALATKFRSVYGMKASPPSLSCYMSAAGIMHIVTLAARPADPQGVLGLSLCLGALKEMEVMWPSAKHASEVLHDYRVRVEEMHLAHASLHAGQEAPGSLAQGDNVRLGIQTLKARMVAEMLGVYVAE